MIAPTTLAKANSVGSPIVVYDTEQKKPVLIFKSVHLCCSYMFQTQCMTEINSFRRIIQRCNDKREIEDRNRFARPLTYRIASREYKERLGDADYLVLDEQYRCTDFTKREEKRKRSLTEDYTLEEVLKVGDLVTIRFGAHTGFTTAIKKIIHKSRSTPGKFYYVLSVRGTDYQFKANILEL